MKKFLLFALCAISAVSAFAETFSINKYYQIYKTKNYHKWAEYCYNAEISVSDAHKQINGYRWYLSYNKFSKEQGLKQLEKFQGKISEKPYKKNIALFLVNIGNIQESIKTFDCLQVRHAIWNYYLREKKNDMMWKSGKDLLLIEGGYDQPTIANKIITHMFRYKPASITKEEQIEFLSKLAQMYPIPGTDFNQWKAFMGFVGYKYKALTGKELF